MAETEALGASVRALRPKAGLPSLRAFTDSTLYPKYAQIIEALRESKVTIDDNLSERELARFITRLMQFMEANLGRDADPKLRRLLTKFPVNVFSDIEPRGALFHILHACYEFAEEKKWDGIDFKDDGLRAANMEMLVKVSKALKRRGLLPSIKAFFAPSIIPEQSDELQRILQTHGAVVVSSPEVASHIIYADTEGTKENQTDAQVLVRYLRTDDTRARVHWWYHPDSYDDWVPVGQVIGMIDETERANEGGPWHVTARWVRDLALFNEWMNEVDYELYADVPRLLSSPSKEANGVVSTEKAEEPSKTRAQPDSPVSEPIAKRLKLRSRSAERDDEESEDQKRVDEEEEEVLSEGNAGDGNIANGVSKSNEDGESPVKPSYSVPSFSSWFDVSKINDIERKACPEFFSGKFESKTPEIYKEIRNYFVESWRAKPKRYITVTSSRGKLIGDWPAILRVHSFLEHWGLINHNVAADTLPLPILSSPPAAVPAFNTTRGSNKVPFVFDDGSVACVNSSRVIGSTVSGSPKKRPRNTRRLLFDKPDDSASESDDDSDGSPRKNTVDYHCDICSQDCSTLRFHCATQSDMDLCETCYTEKKYNTTKMQPRDFIQMKSAGGGIGSQEVDENIWTESETLLLLEALEMYEDNWELVAEHVGSKSKDQCVMQFVRLPIEDRFLDNPPGNCSDPASEKDMAPVEMLKKAGAKKDALARVSSKTALPVPYSGRASIYGADARNNAVASHALNLSTLTTTKLVARPHAIMVSGVREDGFRGNFNDLTPAFPEAEDDDGDVAMTDTPDESSKSPEEKNANGTSVEFSMTTQEPYNSKRESVPPASEIAKSELGQLASEVLIELLEKEPEMLASLDNEGDKELPSQRVAASVALAAAAGRAAQMERLERAELDRLLTMLVEIKLELLRIKLAHFESLEAHEIRLKKLVADESHTRFAREMRAHHRLSIRDPAAIPALNGPIGCDLASDSPSKAARKKPGVVEPSEQTTLVKPTSIRTVSKPESMAHITPSEYFAMQLKEAEEARRKAEEARQEEKRKEHLRQEQARQEQARQLAERLARATAEANAAARARAQQLQQAQLVQQAQQAARQRAQQAAVAPYVNGIVNAHIPNGVTPVQFSAQANGLQHSRIPTPQNVPVQASHYSPHSRVPSAAVTREQQPPPVPPQPTEIVEPAAPASSVSKDDESTGPKTPVLPTKAARTKSRKRSKSSAEKSRSKSRKRAEPVASEDDEDRIVPARPKTKRRSEPIAAEGDTEDDKVPLSELKRSRPTRERRSRSNVKSDTTLKLRVRQKEDTAGGRVKKGRTTRTSLRSARNAISVKLRLPIRPPKPLPLRLRIRPPREGEGKKKTTRKIVEEDDDEDGHATEDEKTEVSPIKKSDGLQGAGGGPVDAALTNNLNGKKMDVSGDGVDAMDVSDDGAEGDPSNKMDFRLRQDENITQVNKVMVGGNETEDEDDD